MTDVKKPYYTACGTKISFAEHSEIGVVRGELQRGYLRTFSEGTETVPSADCLCCTGAYLWENERQDALQSVSSAAGEHVLMVSTANGHVSSVTAAVGKASFLPQTVPVRWSYPLIEDSIPLREGNFRLTALGFRDPYAVVFLETVGDCALLGKAKEIGSLGIFPDGAEVVFAYVRKEKQLYLKCVHRDGSEHLRGNDFCAALAAAVATGRCAPNTCVTSTFNGGELRGVCGKDWSITLTCPVF